MQKQVDFLEANPDFSLVFCNVKVIYSNNFCQSHLGYSNHYIPAKNGYISIMKHPKEVTTLDDLIHGNYIHTPGVVFRNWFLTDEIPEYMNKVSIGDWPLHLFSATKGNLFYFNKSMATYRVHRNGVWSQKSWIEQRILAIFQYPALINSGIFEKKLEIYLKKSLLNQFVGLLKLTDSGSDFNFNKKIMILIKISLQWKMFLPYYFVSLANSSYIKLRGHLRSFIRSLNTVFFKR